MNYVVVLCGVTMVKNKRIVNPNFYVNVADLMLSKPSKKQQHNFVEDGEVIPIISIEIKDMELVSENEFRI